MNRKTTPTFGTIAACAGCSVSPDRAEERLIRMARLAE
jgi:hypothetical protein